MCVCVCVCVYVCVCVLQWRYKPNRALAFSVRCLQVSVYPRLLFSCPNDTSLRGKVVSHTSNPKLDGQVIPFCLGHHF